MLVELGVHAFPTCISLKMNLIVWLEFELAYYVHAVSTWVMRLRELCPRIFLLFDWGPYQLCLTIYQIAEVGKHRRFHALSKGISAKGKAKGIVKHLNPGQTFHLLNNNRYGNRTSHIYIYIYISIESSNKMPTNRPNANRYYRSLFQPLSKRQCFGKTFLSVSAGDG